MNVSKLKKTGDIVDQFDQPTVLVIVPNQKLGGPINSSLPFLAIDLFNSTFSC